MNIEVVDIKDRGNKVKERIVLKALSNLDIGYYIVFLTTKTGENSFSSTPKNIFWFPDKDINEGDLVVLYTKSGKNSIKDNKSGNRTHFFYWGLTPPVFENKNKIAVVIESSGWT
ncbi:hypothetical protein [Neptunitalea lumnitzerae]|uniref:Uncharacterized protein n=1 Tax=Neptunitalea lumnitzerae TaxID=2965509 RepID=A0ABQ5MF31_9FLAO|nr:hypothetical protein [Neptunitalea sp. Y10]GLB47994.1 hypothetical protein Y10_03620 [Neptunitalea sp. Y10]